MIKNELAALVLLGAALGAGCHSARAADPEPVQGVVELDERTLGFEVAGRVEKVLVQRGDVVAAGAPLASLDTGLARQARDARAAEAKAAAAQAALVHAGSRREDVGAAEAELRAARAVEEVIAKQAERERALVTEGALATARLDDLVGELARAKGERQVREQRTHAVSSGARREELAVADARAAAADSAAALEQERLARHALASPSAGVVLETHVDPGEVVGVGAPVVTIGDAAHPYVDVFVPETRVERVRVGLAASVRVDASNGVFAGKVEHVARRTEFTPRYLFSERERPNLVVRVRVRIDDPELRLHAGLPATVAFEAAPAAGAR